MQEIPYGYCHCGCGEKTTVSKQNHARFGWVKGEPWRFRQGHGRRLKTIDANKDNAIELFMERVSKTDSCWLWTGYCNKDGYGELSVKDKGTLAHRLSYSLFNKVDPGDNLVCHTCDNPPCVNPGHLFLGDELINARDMVSKGRQRHSEDHGNAKFSNAEASEIKRRVSAGEASRGAVAREYGVHKTTICQMVAGTTWNKVA
jgi:hypothetical protein